MARAALDNLSLQALHAGGALRAKLHAGAPGDPQEAEADRMADAALSGKPAGCHCEAGKPPCASCRAQSLLRKPRQAGPAPPVPDRLGLGPERRLGPAERAFFEPRYGADLSGVRIHDNPEAADSAAGLDARAFSIGERIAFGRGEYRPETGAGRRLLGHELAHIVRGHGGIRRDAGGAGAPAPAKAPDPKTPADFDPCAIDVAKLDNHALLLHFTLAEKYINELLAAKRKGEERFYDYANLLERLAAERAARSRAGHVWLKANVGDVPNALWRLEAAGAGNVISVTPADRKGAVDNSPLGTAIVLTDAQFSEFLEKEKIPTVDPHTFFSRQDPSQPLQPMNLGLPEHAPPAAHVHEPGDPFGLLGKLQAYPRVQTGGVVPFSGLGPWGAGAGAPLSPQSAFQFEPYARPVVTAGPFNYDAESIKGFQADWRGDFGEARFLSPDPESMRVLVDVNRWSPNFELFDVYDPRTGALISIKTQLPPVAGGTPSLATTQDAWRELFGNQDPAKRAKALQKLQANLSPALTQDQMLLSARIAVNPENVTRAQDSLELAIRGGKDLYYEPLLSALLRQQPVSVKLKDGSTKVYSDFTSLRADFTAKPPLMAEQRYRDAVTELAQRARSQIISNGSNAEADLRPRLDYRQRYGFTGAAEFAGIPDTPEGKQAARALQEEYFRKIGMPELFEIQSKGYAPAMKSAASSGGKMGLGMAGVLQLPHLYGSWGTDPYAGRRYLLNTVLGGVGGSTQAAGDVALQAYISQKGLDWAASRALAGRSVAPLARIVPAARFGGSTALGGVASGGITLAGMALDERFFGTDYTRIDYTAKGTRAFVSGSAAAGAGALASAITVASLGGAGGAAGCTVVLPVVGTVACGAVGAAGGFIVGLGGYYLFDYAAGGYVEAAVRESMGEKGCIGKAAPSAPLREPGFHGCFAPHTPVLLADGRSAPIAELAVGEPVLSWHERERRIDIRPVTAVHVMPPASMLELQLEGGTSVQVTEAHKLRTPDGWVAAGDLRPGDLLCRAGSAGALATVAVCAVLPAPACGSVVDLSVEATHTYFAGGILAHNKVF